MPPKFAAALKLHESVILQWLDLSKGSTPVDIP